MTACLVTRLKKQLWWHHTPSCLKQPRTHTHTSHMYYFELRHGFFGFGKSPTTLIANCLLCHLFLVFIGIMLQMFLYTCVLGAEAVCCLCSVWFYGAPVVCPVLLAASATGDIMKCSWMQHTANEVVLIRGQISTSCLSGKQRALIPQNKKNTGCNAASADFWHLTYVLWLPRVTG